MLMDNKFEKGLLHATITFCLTRQKMHTNNQHLHIEDISLILAVGLSHSYNSQYRYIIMYVILIGHIIFHGGQLLDLYNNNPVDTLIGTRSNHSRRVCGPPIVPRRQISVISVS
jgi:hypothetical protein